jgi:hypothetical protein
VVVAQVARILANLDESESLLMLQYIFKQAHDVFFFPP